jgi:membrane protein required for colicin V production
LNIVRISIGVILLFFCILGIRRGLVRQVLDVVGLVAAFIGSFFLAGNLALFAEGRFGLSYGVALAVSAAVIFACTLVIFHFIGLGLQKLFSLTVLGWFDRAMGGIFGVLKGLILVSLILVMIKSLPLRGDFKDRILDDPVTGAIYPVLPVMYDLVASHSGSDFEDIVKTGRGISSRDAKG